MQELDLATEILQVGDKPAAVVALAGYLDTYTAPKFMKALETTIHQGAIHVILDLSELDYMSSAGFGVLAGASQHLADKGGQLLIAGLSDKVRIVFDNLGLTDLVTVVPDRQAALGALQ